MSDPVIPLRRDRMTPDRVEHLKRVIAGVSSLAEMDGVRRQLGRQQELTGEVYRAMERRVEDLAKAEGITPAVWWRHR